MAVVECVVVVIAQIGWRATSTQAGVEFVQRGLIGPSVCGSRQVSPHKPKVADIWKADQWGLASFTWRALREQLLALSDTATIN